SSSYLDMTRQNMRFSLGIFSFYQGMRLEIGSNWERRFSLKDLEDKWKNNWSIIENQISA
ncbi:MAG: hypothetical protein COV91_03125, partial [Candidatus Taylorbacteria bacterium CG11_big_fil_rev_8_21_14_0_20_46_11]